jgi:hypothetical protein
VACLLALVCVGALRWKNGFLSHFYIKTIILPRQAREKNRENSKRDRFVAEHRLGAYGRSMPQLQASARTLEQVPATQEGKNQLEIFVLFKMLQSYDMSLDTQAITARMNQTMVNWRPDIWTQLNIIQFTEAMIEGLSAGNAVVFGSSLVRMMRMSLQELATVHASDYTQRCQLLTWQSFSGVQYAVGKDVFSVPFSTKKPI